MKTDVLQVLPTAIPPELKQLVTDACVASEKEPDPDPEWAKRLGEDICKPSPSWEELERCKVRPNVKEGDRILTHDVDAIVVRVGGGVQPPVVVRIDRVENGYESHIYPRDVRRLRCRGHLFCDDEVVWELPQKTDRKRGGAQVFFIRKNDGTWYCDMDS